METQKSKKLEAGSSFHPRNKHQGRYDFESLVHDCPDLGHFVLLNKYGKHSIDFFDPAAVMALNKALLANFYSIKKWGIPDGYLCPPIPGRADYIHFLADILASYNKGEIPKGQKVKGLDIGVGANCIYPLIGNGEYRWSFAGSEVDEPAIFSANKIIANNEKLKGKIEIRKQENPAYIFQHIIGENEYFDFTICNPPFHASKKEAAEAALRKVRNLKKERVNEIELNFGGKNNELWYAGGGKKFVRNMIVESKLFSNSVFLFSTLVSQKASLEYIYDELKKVKALEVKTVEMRHGNKSARMVAWTFLNHKQREAWSKYKWK